MSDGSGQQKNDFFFNEGSLTKTEKKHCSALKCYVDSSVATPEGCDKTFKVNK